MATLSSCTGGFLDLACQSTGLLPTILIIRDAILVEHWDVIQDEATEEQSKSKAPMFGKSFPVYA